MSTHTSSSAISVLPGKKKSTRVGRGWRTLVAVLLTVTVLLTYGYTAVSIYIATKLVYVPQVPIYATPASLGLQYKDVTFPSREDHLQIRGWFIPGVLPAGQLTTQRTIIMVHGIRTNRADKDAGLLDLSGEFARHGFAVLAFDMRGSGESPPAPVSFGIYEQRDVLGALDFLRSGSLPYSELGRPRAIAGWGLSMGGASLILAAAQAPAIRAIVSDGVAADYIPILEREVPKRGHLPALFNPGAFLAIQAIDDVDLYAARPVDVAARLAPRPIFFIHGDADSYIPLSNIYELAAAARTAPDAHVQTWVVPGAAHAQSYHTQPQAYVSRVMAFYTAALGPDSGTK